MSQEDREVTRRPSKASAKSVIAYEPFENRELPQISIENDEEGDDKSTGSIIYPRLTEGTDSSYTNTRTNTFDVTNTNTNANTDTNEENEANVGQTHAAPDRLNDKIASARPNVDYQDKLWTQIDVLDDVKKMSEQTSLDNDSFFNARHSKALNELRLAQIELLSTIRNSEKLIDLNIDHQDIWNSKNIDGIRDQMYNNKYFDTISQSVDKVNEKLEDVGKSMKTLDDSSRDIWQGS